MKSRYLVSFSRFVSGPIFASLGLQGFTSRLDLEGYRSQSQAYCLETLNIARTWLRKSSVIQRVSSLLYLHVRKPKQVGKLPEIRNKFNLEVVTTFFSKIWANSTNFEISEFFMKSRSRRFNEVSVSKVTVSTTSLQLRFKVSTILHHPVCCLATVLQLLRCFYCRSVRYSQF